MCFRHLCIASLFIFVFVLTFKLEQVTPLTATVTKRLNAAHHIWQRSILGISWKDRVTNEEVKIRTVQHSKDDILSERRLRWFRNIWYEWFTSAYLDRRCTGRFQGLREVQVVRVQTKARGYAYAKIEYVSVRIFQKIEHAYDTFRNVR